MKKLLLSALILWSSLTFGQTGDRDLLLKTVQPEGSPADTTACLDKVAEALNRQLSGECIYEPAGYRFALDAIRRAGLLRGLSITADRMTRSGRIGSAGYHFYGEDGKVHEGIEAYFPKFRTNTTEDTPMTSEVIFPEYDPSKEVKYAGDDIDFVNYLIYNNMSRDAVSLLKNAAYHPSDTLDYLRGWACYSAKMLGQASGEFSKVGKQSPYYDKSFFFNYICEIHRGNYSRCRSLSESYTGAYSEVLALEKAGLAILTGDKEAFIRSREGFTYSSYSLEENERKLCEIYSKKFETPSKSPFAAAALSAAVPGLGKIYSGRTMEGIGAFLVNASFAAITAENWIKNGIKDWRTIVWGAVSSLFYIGNIYGSYISVGLYNDELGKAQDTAVIYNIHIPLRNIFN